MKKILLIEDEVDIQTVYRDYLIANNLEVDCVDSGTEGLARMSSKEYDLILIDMMLPDITGHILLKKIHKQYPKVKIIVVSNFAADNVIHLAKKNGAVEYILKVNAELPQLLAVIQKHLKLRK